MTVLHHSLAPLIKRVDLSHAELVEINIVHRLFDFYCLFESWCSYMNILWMDYHVQIRSDDIFIISFSRCKIKVPSRRNSVNVRIISVLRLSRCSSCLIPLSFCINPLMFFYFVHCFIDYFSHNACCALRSFHFLFTSLLL